MKKINNWLLKKRRERVEKYMAKLRTASPEEKKNVLEHCMNKAYVPLYFALTSLGAKNFVEGMVYEETTGEWFQIEMRKIVSHDQLING